MSESKVCSDGKMLNVVIQGARVIDPETGQDEVCDILIEDGKLVEIKQGIDTRGLQVVDAAGLVAIPALVDMHTHLREPGFEWKEDIDSGAKAAASGGFGTICAMPNTEPAISNEQIVRFIQDRGRDAVVDVLPVGTITKERQGKELAPIGELADAGVVAITDDGVPVRSAELMRHALQYASMFDVPVISHCEEMDLSAGGQMHFGFLSSALGLQGIPSEAEEIMVCRDLALARLTGGHVHIAHLSAAESVDLIRRAKQAGVKVTAEVTPHHLVLTEDAVKEWNYDAVTKVNPPLRSEDDRQALWEGLVDGTIDVIATDHAPHHEDDKKCEYVVAEFGISGLETAWPLVYTHLVESGKLNLAQAVIKMTVNPARILGIDVGRFAEGMAASICLFDPDSEQQCDPNEFKSKGKNTPFAGMKLKGWPQATIVRGKLVFSTGKLGELETAGGWS